MSLVVWSVMRGPQQQQMARIQQALLRELEEKEMKIQQLRDDLSRLAIAQNTTVKSLQRQIQDAKMIPMLNANFKIENFRYLIGRRS